ncbi:MAG: ATP-binding protein [Gaiellaceae bacterium]
MPELPDGTVTLLFTDIEGSTRLLRELGAEYESALAEHRRALRDAFGEHGGVEVDTQGDAFFFAFADALQAAAAAEAGQRALDGGPVRVRMGIHTGTPTRAAEGYVGLDVHLGARIAAVGHGGQVVLSRATHQLVDGFLARDLGEHRLKDFEPVWLYQLGDEPFPPLKTISNTNLPRPVSSFVGREREVGEVAALLRDGARLVTLTGPGGSGKTRLAIESAAEVVGAFRNGVFWAPLATLRDPDLVLPTIAQAVGAQGDLAAHLGERELLILVDNLEQIIDAAPSLGETLRACPNLKLLVTSRELLRLGGEVEYEVLPLAAPEAVDLFCLRAQLPEGPAVEELCRRLDNMPLALELAAARTKALSPEQILDRLAQRLDLLKGGRDAEPRQATLRATIEWSVDLLSPEDKRLFVRLAVFPGCTLEAAEAVCDADVDGMQSLVEKSLVRHTGERFWMLETIRELATELLDASDESDAIRRRHAEHYLAVAESTCMAVERVEGGTMRHDVALAEQNNFRAALDWAVEHDPALGVRTVVELEQHWVSLDPDEGARRIGELLERARGLPRELRARALRVFGGTTQVAGRPEDALPLYRESLSLYEQLGDEWGTVHLRHRVAVTHLDLDEWEVPRQILEENVPRAQALGSTFLECEALGTISFIAHRDGDLARAIEIEGRHVDAARELGFAWFMALGGGNLAEWRLEAGEVELAEEAARPALAVARSIDDRRVSTWLLMVLAVAARRRGDDERAGRLCGAVEAERLLGPLVSLEDDLARLGDEARVRSPAFEAGLAAGRGLSLDEAAAYALGEAQGRDT